MRALTALLFSVLPFCVNAQTALLMAEEPGCYWCEKWMEEIGPIYPKTPEGQAAPLQQFDILAPPEGITFARRLNFTPTFILVRDGIELHRIEGYPGEDFFWGLLGKMLSDAEIKLESLG